MSKPLMEPTPSKSGWQHLPHIADMGLCGYGDSVDEAFEQAGEALTAIVCDPALVRPEQLVAINCEAPDIELLFVDWLNAIIYEMAVRQMLFRRFQVRIEGNALMATLWGECVDRARHRPAVEVKGATYTELRVARESDGRWFARCVVDV